MKITIQRGVFTKAVVTDNDGVRIPCTNDEDVLRCKSFEKFATLRLEKENEKICSVCGKNLLTK